MPSCLRRLHAVHGHGAHAGKANVCATQVPNVIDIVARYCGIYIPERVKEKGDDARMIP